MREGLLWYDPDGRRPVQQKIAAAAARYHERCKRPANCCHVHPADVVEYPGLVVVADERMPRHHFWVGVDEGLAPAAPQRRPIAAPPSAEAPVPSAQPVPPPGAARAKRARRPAAEVVTTAAPVEPKRSTRTKPPVAAPAPAPTVSKRPTRAKPPAPAPASAPAKAKRAARTGTPPAPKPPSPPARKQDKMKRAGAA